MTFRYESASSYASNRGAPIAPDHRAEDAAPEVRAAQARHVAGNLQTWRSAFDEAHAAIAAADTPESHAAALARATAALTSLRDVAAHAREFVEHADAATRGVLEGAQAVVDAAVVAHAAAPPVPAARGGGVGSDGRMAFAAALPPADSPRRQEDPSLIGALTEIIEQRLVFTDLDALAQALTTPGSLRDRFERLSERARAYLASRLTDRSLRQRLRDDHNRRVRTPRAAAAAADGPATVPVTPDTHDALGAVVGPLAGQLGVNPAVVSGERGQQMADAHGADGVAHGGEVALHPSVDPSTPAGVKVIAHELVHQAQAKLPAEQDEGRGAAEDEAEELATIAAAGGAMRMPSRAIDLNQPAGNRDALPAPPASSPAAPVAGDTAAEPAASTPGGALTRLPGQRYSVFAATGKPYIIEQRGRRPGAWIVRDWVVVNGELRGDSWYAPECAREVLAAMGTYDAGRLDFAASKLLFRMRRAVDYLSIDADAADATGLAHGQSAVVDRADGGGLHVTIGLDDPTILPRTEHPLTAQEKIRALDAVVAYTGLTPMAGGVMKAVSATGETPSITGNGTVFLELDRQFCRDLFGPAYDRWWRSRSRAAANQSAPKLALSNYYQRPIPGQITHYADIVESGERVRFEVVVDWPTEPVPPDPEVYDAPPMVTPSKVSNVAMLKCRWRFERVAAVAPPAASVDQPSFVHTLLTEAMQSSAPAADRGQPDAPAGAAPASGASGKDPLDAGAPAATNASPATASTTAGASSPTTQPSAAAPAGEQATSIAEVFHAFRLGPGEQEGTWRVFCDATFDEYFAPTAMAPFDVRVVSAQRAISELKQEAFAGLGAEPRPQAGRWRTDLDKDFAATPAAGPEGSFFSSPENNDPHAAERKIKREQLTAVRDYLDDDGSAERNAETLKAIDRELDRQWDTEAALASDRLSGAQPFEVRGTYLSRTEGLPSGALQLHGTVRVERKSKRQGDTVDIDDVYVVQIRDLSRHFEQEDFTFRGSGPSFAAALENAFEKLAVAYPKGMVALEAEELRGDALRRSDGSAGDGGALGTGKALGFQRSTETTWKKVKETVWQPVASTVTNLAAIAIMAVAPEAAPVIIPGLVAYNAIPVIDNVLTQKDRGTLTNKELALSVGEIALNLLPVIGSAARFAGAWFVIEGANWGGQVLLLNERAKQRAHQLQNQQVAALAEHYAALVELKKHSTADHAALDRAEAQLEDEVRKVNSAIADAFNAMAGESLLYAVAGSIVHRALSVPGGPKALADFLDHRGVASVSNGDEGGGGRSGGGVVPTREPRAEAEGDVGEAPATVPQGPAAGGGRPATAHAPTPGGSAQAIEALDPQQYRPAPARPIDGSMPKLVLVDGSTGRHFLFKPNRQDAPLPHRAVAADIAPESIARRAKAAEVVADEIGIETPDIRIVRYNGEVGSLQEWRSGKNRYSLAKLETSHPELYARVVASPEYARLRSEVDTFDYALNNLDRNKGNLLVTLDDAGRVVELTGIDHDLTFTRTKERFVDELGIWTQGLPEKYSRPLVAKLRAIAAAPDAFRQKLGQHLDPQEIDSALQRIDTILGDVDNKLATRGDTGTFFGDVDGDVAAKQAAKAPPELFATRPPLEKTFEHALNPQAYLDDVVKYYGINLRGVKAIYDPTLEPGKLGVTRASEGGMVIRIGRDAFVDEATLANTVAHELSHARDYQRGTHKEHGDASSMGDGTVYGSGNALERMIRMALGGDQ